MKSHILLFTFSILFWGCKEKVIPIATKDYTLESEGGVYVEKFESSNSNPNRYTANNTIYLDGNAYTFDYYYQNKSGEKFKFENHKNVEQLSHSERSSAWSFVPLNKMTDNTIDKVVMKVKYGLEPFGNNNPDYNQSIISYKFLQLKGEAAFSSATGLIENEKNIWAHPPRNKFFQVLELNPFPMIKTPYAVGNKWGWSLQIGDFWGDKRWKVWEGSIENTYTYEIKDKKNISTAVGELECFIIQSEATSRIGKTYLTSYFNMDLGFVKLDYTNIDSSKTVLELIDFRN
ncbi:MAG: hypothetical protein P1U56_26225 [Saprospiraceae bacterium]|nr:hypothetical protein [Saprospiraceae bacterium]